MYQRHFGFKERPFRLVPDPAYLFMGRSHREALAHLTHAVQSGEGFATVIGEVGTGKTTLCRALLEGLDDGVASAYVFNPPVDSLELMRAVNRDFGLDPAPGDALQDLVEALNRFLMVQKAAGRGALLVIDEAQRLSRAVLEQIRLLSNLETTRSKLLCIVLAGQPELAATLADHRLRQLRQRITVASRLRPLTRAETGAYIRHRLAVAAAGAPVAFTPAAVGVIFAFARGIPRLINLGCDRALICAYAAGAGRVHRGLARRAVAELTRDAPAPRRRPSPLLWAALAAALLALGLSLKANMFTGIPGLLRAALSPAAAVTAPAPAAKSPRPAAPWAMDRSRALEVLLELWGLRVAAGGADPADDPDFIGSRVEPLGWSVYAVDGLEMVVRLNLPALLVLDPAAGGYAVLEAIQGDRYLLSGASGLRHPLARRELEAFWSGRAYVLWRDFHLMAGRIPGEAGPETVLNLKMMLRALGYPGLDALAVFDDATRSAVVDFQTRVGLPADGVVGPQTKIALYHTRPELAMPALRPLAPVERAASWQEGS